jgi:hypothetical protein
MDKMSNDHIKTMFNHSLKSDIPQKRDAACLERQELDQLLP